MRAARLIISGAIAVMLGLIWTVAQTGVTDTNAHLCEFAAHFFPGIGSECQASDYIVKSCGAAALLSALFFVVDLSGILSRLRPKAVSGVGAPLTPRSTVYHQHEQQLPQPPLIPDMPIREVFNYIDPTQLDDPHWANWAKVGGDVKDRLSIGQISAWGRVSDPYGKSRPLTRIAADFWDFAEWTYEFFADGTELRVHARDRRNIQGAKSYHDIRFNRAEVVGVGTWPVANNISPQNERGATSRPLFAPDSQFTEPRILSESYSIKWEDGSDSGLFKNVFFLSIGNQSPSGKTLRAVRATISHPVERTVFIRDRSTIEYERDIRHGEFANFELGTIVSKDRLGLMYGPLKVHESYKADYTGRTSPSFKVYESYGNPGYVLGDNVEPWMLLVTVTADDARAARIQLSIDLNKRSDPVTCSEIG